MKLGALLWPFGRKSDTVYQRWLELLTSGASSRSGPAVNLASAMRVSAAFACMRVISQGGAQLPFKLFREASQNSLRRIAPAREHHVYDLVASKPNAWQTAFEFREQLLLHACLGNAYVFKGYWRGKLQEMFLLNPGQVVAEQQEDRSVRYRVRSKAGSEVDVPASSMWHVRGPSWDGFLGLDTLKVAKEALGLSMALEESHARLHANGVRPSGLYSVEAALSPEQHQKLAAWLKREAGAASTGAPLILDRGAKWTSTAMTGVDAQHKETRDQQIEEVCRFFGVLPIMIGHSGDKANTYASAEAMFTAHRVHTLDPWLARIEQSADVNLLSDEERGRGYYFKFVANGLLRASAKDQAEYLAKALGAGGSPAWMTQDEARAVIELDPMGGDAARLPIATNVPPAAAT